MGKRKEKGIIKTKSQPKISKKPRVDPYIRETLNSNPVWQIGCLDIEGPWGWMNVNKQLFFEELIPKIQNFETMYWRDILGRNNHEVQTYRLSREAKKRLEALKLDDFDSLVSLRLTGTNRIWGIKTENIYKILWWDPDHEVCPSKLKHT